MMHSFSLSRKSLLEIFTHPTQIFFFFSSSLSGLWVAVGRCRTKDKSALFSLTGNSRAEQHLSPLIHYPTLHLASLGLHTSSFLDLSLGLITHLNLQWADINELSPHKLLPLVHLTSYAEQIGQEKHRGKIWNALTPNGFMFHSAGCMCSLSEALSSFYLLNSYLGRFCSIRHCIIIHIQPRQLKSQSSPSFTHDFNHCTKWNSDKLKKVEILLCIYSIKT